LLSGVHPSSLEYRINLTTAHTILQVINIITMIIFQFIFMGKQQLRITDGQYHRSDLESMKVSQKRFDLRLFTIVKKLVCNLMVNGIFEKYSVFVHTLVSGMA